MNACSTCANPIENTAVTGIFCQACHDRDLAPKPGWKAYFTGPTYVGLVAGVAPFFAHVTVNGLDYVAAACGAVAVLAGGAAVGLAARTTDDRSKRIGAAALVLVLGLLQVGRSNLLGH